MKIASLVDDFLKTYLRAGISSKFFLGFACGIPFLLRLTVLDLWLKECGVSNATIGLFTFLQWPFSLKFLWAPFIEETDFPILSKILGRRRGWAVASQILLFFGLIGMATANPHTGIASLMFYSSLVAFADGCQNMSLYAYQLDRVGADMFGPAAGIFIFGYKIGMFFSKSITIYLAHYCGWNFAYYSMAFSIFLCTVFILCVKEPEISQINEAEYIAKTTLSFEEKKKSTFELIRMVKAAIFECLIRPFRTFVKNKDWIGIISVVMLYRAGDRIAQKMAKLFYVDMGFSMLEIANVVQVFGTVAALLGGIVGGYLVKRLGLKRAMFWGGVVHAFGCLSYVVLAHTGYNIKMLYATVFIENVTSGTIATAFVAFLYSLCNSNHATTQYALMWAFYDLGGTLCRTFSGIIADVLGWTGFF
ncbi:MAG: MFS transporter, partial [Holosporaceae bacterium]|nr:MFS transporter [Holosporaceae bacterium]